MNVLTAPSNLRAEVFDEYAKFYFDTLEGAAGYRLSFFKNPDSVSPFRVRYTEKAGKLVRGFRNDVEYYVSIAAFVRDEDFDEIYGEESERIGFTTVCPDLKVTRKICMKKGEKQHIDYSYKDNTTSYPVFSSNNPSVVTVNDNGDLFAVANGEADITLSFPGNVSAEISVSVGRNYNRFTLPSGRLIFTGDLMCTAWHQRKAALYGYDFSSSLNVAKDIFKTADYVIGNLETVTFDSTPYEWEQLRTAKGGSNCNSPSRFLDALKIAGFNILVTANNHNCDCGAEGLAETVSLIKRKGMINSGTCYDNPVFVYAAGIKVALISLTMITNGMDMGEHIDTGGQTAGVYSEEYCKSLIKEAGDSGAEYIVVYMHWGMMNSFSVSDDQQKAAQFIADCGADLIVGSHPHLLQKTETLTSVMGKKVPVAYSLGNFLTSMKEMTGNRDTAALVVDINRSDDGIVSSVSFIPFYSRILKNDISVEPVNFPFSYEEIEAKARINYIMGSMSIPMLKPRIQCFGSVILRTLFDGVDRYDVDIDHILLSPASITGEGHPEYANTKYRRVNTDISKEPVLTRSHNPNEYCMLDFYAAASLKLLKLRDTYYTANDAFYLSEFYKDHKDEFTEIEQPDATDICTAYIETMSNMILQAYDHKNIILLRSRIPEISANGNTLKHVNKMFNSLNDRIEWLEDLFIVYTDPIVIDISRDYFADNTDTGSISNYENLYYDNVINIIEQITHGSTVRYYHESNPDMWFRRAMKYYDNISESGHWNWLCKDQDAASLFLQNAPRSFLAEHSREIIYLKEHHIMELRDVPFIEYMSPEMQDMAQMIIESLNADDAGDESDQKLE